MIRPRLCAALMFCGLLAFASTAAAECAWVVWVEESWSATYKQDERPTVWTLVEAYPLLADCQNAQAAKIKVLLSRDGRELHGNIVTRQFPVGYNQSIVISYLRVICVPDTIDPRGPKGR
jgi:hypothetical protein